ncbi:MAG: FtsX-like permease family protein, partial [Bacteroidota bacterium]
ESRQVDTQRSSTQYNLFHEDVGYVDPEFLSHFHFTDLTGQRVSITHRDAIAIQHTTALKWFGHSNVVGHLIDMIDAQGSRRALRIAHVIRKHPQNISFQFDVIMPIDQYFSLFNIDRNSRDHRIDATFLKLKDDELNPALDVLNHTLENTRPDGQIVVDNYRLDDLKQWAAIESDLFARSFSAHLHPASVMGVVSSALAILLLACFNYVNTSIAIAGRRLKEVGLRKVFGSSRRQLIAQFVMENILLILVSMLLAVYLLTLLIPAYNALYEIEVVQMTFISWQTIAIVVVSLLLIITVLAAAYPAIYLSGLSSLKIFREKVTLSGKNLFSKALLSFQLVLCFYNLFSLFVFLDNATFQEKMDRGYELARVINIPLSEPSQYNPLAARLSSAADVSSVSGTQQLIGFDVSRVSLIHEGVDIYPQYLKVGAGYLPDMGVALLKGRWFRGAEGSDSSAVIINQYFEKT